MYGCRNRQDKNADLASPPGYNPSVGQVYTESSKENDSNMLIIKKSWDLALGPLKQVSKIVIEIFENVILLAILGYGTCHASDTS